MSQWYNSFQTEDITIGIDKKIQSHSLLGLALKIGYDYSDLGVTGTSLGTHNLGISIYYSELLDKNTNFKYVLGINKLDIKTIRYFKNNRITVFVRWNWAVGVNI